MRLELINQGLLKFLQTNTQLVGLTALFKLALSFILRLQR